MQRLLAVFHREFHWPLRPSQPPSENAQGQNQETSRCRDGRLCCKGVYGARRLHPVNLHIRSHEAAHRPRDHDPRTHLATSLGISSQKVRVERDGRDHDANDLPGDENGEHHVVIGMFDSEAEEEDGDGHDGGGEPDDYEAGFGLDVA